MCPDDSANSGDSTESSLRRAGALEKTYDIAAFVASAIPVSWLTGPVASVLGGLSVAKKMERIESALRDLGRRVEQSGAEAAKLYVSTEDFASLCEQTLRRIGDERIDEKRALYTAFLAGTIKISGKYAYSQELEALRVLDELQPAHIALLIALAKEPSPATASDGWMTSSASQTLRERMPGTPDHEIQELYDKTGRLWLSKGGGLNAMASKHAAEDLGHLITPLGMRLLELLRD